MRPYIKKAILGYSNVLFPFIEFRRSQSRPNVSGELTKIDFFLSFDLDYSRDIKLLPLLLAKLKQYHVKASFACIGKFIELYPDEHRLILSEGHEILNHSYSHPNNDEINPHAYYTELNEQEQFQEIKHMQEVSERILQYRPIGFRLPHFGSIVIVNMPKLYQSLKSLGMKYDTSLLKFNTPKQSRDIYETGVKGIYEMSISTCPYHPFTACDSYHVFRSDRYVYRMIHKYRSLAETFIKLIDVCYPRQEMINVYLDPFDVLANDSLDRIIEYAQPYCQFKAYEDVFRSQVTSPLKTVRPPLRHPLPHLSPVGSSTGTKSARAC